MIFVVVFSCWCCYGDAIQIPSSHSLFFPSQALTTDKLELYFPLLVVVCLCKEKFSSMADFALCLSEFIVNSL